MGYPDPRLYMTPDELDAHYQKQLHEFSALLPLLAVAMPDKNGGVQLRFAQKTRIAFASRAGIQPNPGDVYEVVHVSDNAKHSVWFCQLGRKFECTSTRVKARLWLGDIWFANMNHPAFSRPFDNSCSVDVVNPVGGDFNLNDVNLDDEFDALLLPPQFAARCVYIL